MKKNIKSVENRIAEGRGTGDHAAYKPWILCREVSSIGTCAEPVDWKHGRRMQLLSQGEYYAYLLLRWRDDVDDIREQFPLSIDDTGTIAEQYGISHSRTEPMTTDLLVTFTDGHIEAYSIKNNRSLSEKEKRSLLIEKTYWEAKQIPWHLIFKEDLDEMKVFNIRTVIIYWDKKDVHDDFSMVKHLIAHKHICPDMSKMIDYRKLVEDYITSERSTV